MRARVRSTPLEYLFAARSLLVLGAFTIIHRPLGLACVIASEAGPWCENRVLRKNP